MPIIFNQYSLSRNVSHPTQTCHTCYEWMAYHLKMNCAIKLFSLRQIVTSNEDLIWVSEHPNHLCMTGVPINSDLLRTLYCCTWDTFMSILLDQHNNNNIKFSLPFKSVLDLFKSDKGPKLHLNSHLEDIYHKHVYHTHTATKHQMSEVLWCVIP